MRGPEAKLQDWIIKRLRKKGFLVTKLSQKYERGWPDLMCFKRESPWGMCFFIEVKAPGKKPRMLQELTMRQLEQHNIQCFVAMYREDVDGILEGIEWRLKTK